MNFVLFDEFAADSLPFVKAFFYAKKAYS